MIYPTYTEPGFNAAALALSRARALEVYWRRLYLNHPTQLSLRMVSQARTERMLCENVIAFKVYRHSDTPAAYRFAGLI